MSSVLVEKVSRQWLPMWALLSHTTHQSPLNCKGASLMPLSNCRNVPLIVRYCDISLVNGWGWKGPLVQSCFPKVYSKILGYNWTKISSPSLKSVKGQLRETACFLMFVSDSYLCCCSLVLVLVCFSPGLCLFPWSLFIYLFIYVTQLSKIIHFTQLFGYIVTQFPGIYIYVLIYIYR